MPTPLLLLEKKAKEEEETDQRRRNVSSVCLIKSDYIHKRRLSEVLVSAVRRVFDDGDDASTCCDARGVSVLCRVVGTAPT